MLEKFSRDYAKAVVAATVAREDAKMMAATGLGEEIDLDSQIVDVELDPRARYYAFRYGGYKSPVGYSVPGCVRLGPDAWQPCRIDTFRSSSGELLGADRAYVAGDIQPTREAAWLAARKTYIALATSQAAAGTISGR